MLRFDGVYSMLGHEGGVRLVVDGVKQVKGDWLSDWEAREPGSTAAVLSGFQRIQEDTPETEVGINILQELHQIATTKVTFRTREGKPKEVSPGALKTGPNGFGLELDTNVNNKCPNITEAGLDELINEGLVGFEVNGGTLEASSSNECKKRNFAEIHGALLRGEKVRCLGYMSEKPEELNAKIAEIFTTFYQETKKIQSDIESSTAGAVNFALLTPIAKLVRSLESGHFFPDANCRTVCVLLLNLLLRNHGFIPCMLKDPNRFDAYGLTELVSEIQRGMEKTCKVLDPSSVDQFTLSEEDQVTAYNIMQQPRYDAGSSSPVSVMNSHSPDNPDFICEISELFGEPTEQEIVNAGGMSYLLDFSPSASGMASLVTSRTPSAVTSPARGSKRASTRGSPENKNTGTSQAESPKRARTTSPTSSPARQEAFLQDQRVGEKTSSPLGSPSRVDVEKSPPATPDAVIRDASERSGATPLMESLFRTKHRTRDPGLPANNKLSSELEFPGFQ